MEKLEEFRVSGFELLGLRVVGFEGLRVLGLESGNILGPR